MTEKNSVKIYFAMAIVALVLVLGIFFAYRIYFPYTTSDSSNVLPQQWVPINVNSENLPIVLESNSIIQDLPEESLISLTIGESTYKIERDSVVPGKLTNPDVEIRLPEKYFELIGQSGFCGALKIAKENGEIEISFSGSTTSLAWKYRALGKYRSCLGE